MVDHSSKFDWKTAKLSSDTILTDTFELTPNVMGFFKESTGKRLKINVEFQKWLEQNIGKTLGQAVFEYRAMQTRNSYKYYTAKIDRYRSSGPNNIYDQIQGYALNFLRNNPTLSMEDVRRVLAKKTALNSGASLYDYDPADLDL